MRLKGKAAIVTGAGAGIGRAIAERFAREGARVTVADIDALAGESAVQAIRDAGGDAIFVRADVSSEAEVRAMAEAALRHYGRIDILCNNAAILLAGREARAHELDNETWERTITVNLRGYWLCAKYVIPTMLEQGGGSIINIASATGLLGFPCLTAYSTSKAGVIGLTRSMAKDYAPDGIRVNAIIPGSTDTPMNAAALSDPQTRETWAKAIPLGRLGNPDDLSGIAVFLASDDSAFSTGALFTVDGGRMATGG